MLKELFDNQITKYNQVNGIKLFERRYPEVQAVIERYMDSTKTSNTEFEIFSSLLRIKTEFAQNLVKNNDTISELDRSLLEID